MKILDKILKLLMIISITVLSVVTFYQVLKRFVLGSPVPWGQDIIRLSFVYTSLLGAAYCLKTGDHLNIDVIYGFINEKTKKLLNIIISFAILLFFIFLFIFGIKFCLTGVEQYSPYTKLPMLYYYMSIPISAFYLIVYNIEIIINQLKDFKQGGKK